MCFRSAQSHAVYTRAVPDQLAASSMGDALNTSTSIGSSVSPFQTNTLKLRLRFAGRLTISESGDGVRKSASLAIDAIALLSCTLGRGEPRGCVCQSPTYATLRPDSQ